MGGFGLDAKNHVTSTGLLGAISVGPTAGLRLEIIELIMTGSGSEGPQDIMHRASGARSTDATAGTKTDTAPTKYDEASATSQLGGTLASILYTAQPTVLDTVHEVMWGFNQRGGMRWARPEGSGIKVNGDEGKNEYVFQVISSLAGNVDANMQWVEP